MATQTPGLPPRVRGNLRRVRRRAHVLRPTPARAGQPAPPTCRRTPGAAYPRACGATAVRDQGVGDVAGLPPRVRGNLPLGGVQVAVAGPTPARAGQPSWSAATPTTTPAYPRACGATPPQKPVRASLLGLPPRVRGNLALVVPRAGQRGPTPARAGQPPCRAPPGWAAGAYPRACGATADGKLRGLSVEGLPPRVRGNPRT